MDKQADELKKGTPERRLRAAKLRLNRTERQFLELMEKIRVEKPELFQRLICEGIVGTGYQGINVVLFSESGEIIGNTESRWLNRFRYLAELILDRLDGKRLKPNAPYISLRSCIEADADVTVNTFAFNPYSVNFHNLNVTGSARDAYVSHVRWKFFDNAAEALNWSSMVATRMIYRGVPIFEKRNESEGFYPVAHDDEMHVYLRQKGKLEEVTVGYELADWVDRYYVKSDHVRMHDAVFYSDLDLSPEQLETRRSILMTQCGTAVSRDAVCWPWGSHQTDLLRKLALAGREWWSTYDQDVPGTAPTNEEVSGWLESQGVAKRVAEVMAQILRADGLSTGPRK